MYDEMFVSIKNLEKTKQIQKKTNQDKYIWMMNASFHDMIDIRKSCIMYQCNVYMLCDFASLVPTDKIVCGEFCDNARLTCYGESHEKTIQHTWSNKLILGSYICSILDIPATCVEHHAYGMHWEAILSMNWCRMTLTCPSTPLLNSTNCITRSCGVPLPPQPRRLRWRNIHQPI